MNWLSVIGFSAATLTTVSFIPQLYKALKTKQVKDVSFYMYSIIVTGILLWFIYGICLKDWPIILANGISLLLTGWILILKLKYK
jgi:MtN3 and saliva related transmembrane protein